MSSGGGGTGGPSVQVRLQILPGTHNSISIVYNKRLYKKQYVINFEQFKEKEGENNWDHL